MKKNKASTQSLLGIKSFSRYGILTNGKEELVFFLVSPTNISVLSRINIGQKINHLMQLLSAQPDIEIVCTDARENFDSNKHYLDWRIEGEQNHQVKSLLLKDKIFLDEIQIHMSTAREFVFIARLRNETDKQTFTNLNRIQKLINEQGFECRRAKKNDIKRILSRYFGINVPNTQIDDIDGQAIAKRWFAPYFSEV